VPGELENGVDMALIREREGPSSFSSEYYHFVIYLFMRWQFVVLYTKPYACWTIITSVRRHWEVLED
jgi:hypothetical protein